MDKVDYKKSCSRPTRNCFAGIRIWTMICFGGIFTKRKGQQILPRNVVIFFLMQKANVIGGVINLFFVYPVLFLFFLIALWTKIETMNHFFFL